MYGPGTLDERMTRRSIYFTVKRSRLVPTLQLFDAPESLVSLGQRPPTTIAPQALHLMNNPHVRGYAGRLAGQLEPHAKVSPATAIVLGYLTTLSRPPEPSELARSVAFVEEQLKRYAGEKRKSPLSLALADFCQVLFGLNEFVYVY